MILNPYIKPYQMINAHQTMYYGVVTKEPNSATRKSWQLVTQQVVAHNLFVGGGVSAACGCFVLLPICGSLKISKMDYDIMILIYSTIILSSIFVAYNAASK
jgi:hypothetical protein